MFNKQGLKLKRMASLVAVLSKYGFKDVLARLNSGIKTTESVGESEQAKASIYKRIRMVLEEMGPSFIKLGQAFSNREDLLPKELIRELQNLQDNVESADLDVAAILEESIGSGYKDHFQDIDTKPLASASIAQVYRATLKTGEKVALKIKRPHIDAVIEGDLLLMKDMANMLCTYFDFAQRINLEQAVSTFEKTLLSELNLVNERENLERLARNFKNTEGVFVPKVYPYLSNNAVLCMEFIDGAKVTDAAFLAENGLNPAILADKGLQIYLTQILEHGFFHADPHAGNIMVLADGRLAFIDLGAMGSIFQADQELLEDVVLNIMTKNVSKLIALLKKMAVQIPNEKKLHDDLADILTMVNTQNLEDLNVMLLINKFKDILFENRIIMPDYYILLVRGLALIEGVGRTLNPEMNIVKSIEPYVLKIIKRRLTPQYLLNKGISKLSDLNQDLTNVPTELRQIVQHLYEGKLSFQTESKEQQKTNVLIKSVGQDVVVAIVLGANMIATALVLAFNTPPKIGGLPVLGVLGLGFSGVLFVFLLVKMLRK
jgi:ubiquinone biosynthesis protein